MYSSFLVRKVNWEACFSPEHEEEGTMSGSGIHIGVTIMLCGGGLPTQKGVVQWWYIANMLSSVLLVWDHPDSE